MEGEDTSREDMRRRHPYLFEMVDEDVFALGLTGFVPSEPRAGALFPDYKPFIMKGITIYVKKIEDAFMIMAESNAKLTMPENGDMHRAAPAENGDYRTLSINIASSSMKEAGRILDEIAEKTHLMEFDPCGHVPEFVLYCNLHRAAEAFRNEEPGNQRGRGGIMYH